MRISRFKISAIGCVALFAMTMLGCRNEVPDRDMPGGIMSGNDYQALRARARANENQVAMENAQSASSAAAKRAGPLSPTTLRATTVPAAGGATTVPAAPSAPAAPAAPAAPSVPAVPPAPAPAPAGGTQ